MSEAKKYIKHNSVGKIAQHYCIDLRTLKKWIQYRNKELSKSVEDHLCKSGYVLPPDLVDKIYETLGAPK